MTTNLIRIQDSPFSIEETCAAVKTASKGIGALCVFVGTGRDISKGAKISGLDFEHYPGMAEKKLHEIRSRGLANFAIIELAIIHRTGHIAIGEDIVLIVAASSHRNDAFMACEWAITELKRVTPIWKRETTETGEVWVSQTP